MMLSIFSCVDWPSVCLLGKMSVQFLCSCFNWVVCLLMLNCLFDLDINPLVISFANTFSHSVGCLFIFLRIYFTVQKLLGLIRSHLYIFAFIPFALGDRSKKILLQFMSKCSAYEHNIVKQLYGNKINFKIKKNKKKEVCLCFLLSRRFMVSAVFFKYSFPQ